MDSVVKGNHKGIGQMLRSQFMQDAMQARAEMGMAFAIGEAPTSNRDQRRTSDNKPRYKDCFLATSGVQVGIDGKRRAYGRLENFAPHAAHVEFGRGRLVPGEPKGAGTTAEVGPGGHHILLRSLIVMGGQI